MTNIAKIRVPRALSEVEIRQAFQARDQALDAHTHVKADVTDFAHKTTHQNGGTDEISVAGLSGELADPQPPKTHATSHQPGGTDAMAVDAAAATGSLRTLGTSATSACAGNDARLSDSRAPNGAASGDLTGSYPGPSVVAASDTAAGKIEIATAAEVAAVASTTLAVTPGRLKNAVNAVKAWVSFAPIGGTGAITPEESFNVTSVADNGLGSFTVVWADDYVNRTDYCVFVSCLNDNLNETGGVATDKGGGNTHTAAQTGIYTFDGVGALLDAQYVYVMTVGIFA